jgi:hypothetical protein
MSRASVVFARLCLPKVISYLFGRAMDVNRHPTKPESQVVVLGVFPVPLWLYIN